MVNSSSGAATSATQSSSNLATKTLQDLTSSRLLYTEIKMNSNIHVGGQYSELALSAINLNGGSLTQDKSSFSYYRLFYLGKPVSEFYCKACQNGLGHIAPEKCNRCDRCRAFNDNLGSSERKVVGFNQCADGITMGEYVVSVRSSVPFSSQLIV